MSLKIQTHWYTWGRNNVNKKHLQKTPKFFSHTFFVAWRFKHSCFCIICWLTASQPYGGIWLQLPFLERSTLLFYQHTNTGMDYCQYVYWRSMITFMQLKLSLIQLNYRILFLCGSAVHVVQLVNVWYYPRSPCRHSQICWYSA